MATDPVSISTADADRRTETTVRESASSLYEDSPYVDVSSSVTDPCYKGDESLRHTFFIVKGQYRKGVLPSFTRSDGDTVFVGCYDPSRDTTEEWYMLLDNTEFECRACGGDLNKVLRSLSNIVRKYKTREEYYKHLSKVTTSDYYDTHYLGHKPLTSEQRSKKAEGRSPRTSPVMRELYAEVMKRYSYYYDERVTGTVEETYKDLKDCGRKRFKKRSPIYNSIKRKKAIPDNPF